MDDRTRLFDALALLAALLVALGGCSGGRTPIGAGVLVPLDADEGPARDITLPDFGARDVTEADVPTVPPGARITIATWNVHFFWDDVCDSRECGGSAFEAVPSTAEVAERAAEVADDIRALDADIVLLQEIENDRALTTIFDELYPEYVAARLGETGFAGSVDVALVTRRELRDVRLHRATPITLPDGTETHFARELLEAHVRVGDTRVIVLVAHFKSQHGDDADWRLAEARGAHDVTVAVAAAHPDALVVLGGDLNDDPGTPPLEALEGSGRLLRVARELPGDGAATYWFDGPRALDHLFVSTEAAGRYLPGTVAVVTNRPGWLQYGGSDHAALRAEFALPATTEDWDTIPGLRRAPPAAGAPARVVGVVTAVGSDTLGLQLPTALRDEALGAAWSGLAVRPGAFAAPVRGSYVAVGGVWKDDAGQPALADLAELVVLVPAYPEPPAEDVTAAEVAADGARAAELQGVVVRVADALVTAVEPPPRAGDVAPTNAFVLDGVLTVDDVFWRAAPLPGVGDRVSVTGLLGWCYDAPCLLPRGADDLGGPTTGD